MLSRLGRIATRNVAKSQFYFFSIFFFAGTWPGLGKLTSRPDFFIITASFCIGIVAFVLYMHLLAYCHDWFVSVARISVKLEQIVC